MAITNSVVNSISLAGVVPATISQKGLSQFQSTGNALSGGSQQTTTLTWPTSVTFSRGIVRVKFYNPGGTTTTIAVIVQGSDGTNTVVVFSAPATGISTAGTAWNVDYTQEFICEFNLTSMSVLSTLAGTTTGTLDFEVIGEP